MELKSDGDMRIF